MLRHSGRRLARAVLSQYSSLERTSAAEQYARILGGNIECRMSSLPEDIAEAARKAKFPERTSATQSMATRSTPSEDPGTASTSQQQQHSSDREDVVSSMMFPWEKRQLQGGALSTWEKYYWGVFVVAVAIFLFNRAGHWNQKDPKEVEEEENRKKRMEELKKQKARMILAGSSVLEEEDDPFEGLSPEEIQVYVQDVTGANAKDPFEGMSPEEINQYLSEQQSAST